MREIDLNSLYVLPPYYAYDQSAYPKRGQSIHCWNVKSRIFFFFLMVGVWQRTSLVRSLVRWDPPCQIHKSPEEDNVLLSIE